MASIQKVAVIGTFAALQGCDTEPVSDKQTIQSDGKTILDDAVKEVQEAYAAGSSYMKGRKIQEVQDFSRVVDEATKKLPKEHKEAIDGIFQTIEDSVKQIANEDTVKKIPSAIQTAVDELQEKITDEKVKQTLTDGLTTFQKMLDDAITPQPTPEEDVEVLTDFAENGLVAEKRAKIMAAFRSYPNLEESQRTQVDQKIDSLKKSVFRGIKAKLPCFGEKHEHKDVAAFRAEVIDAKNPDMIKINPLKKFLPFGIPKDATVEAQEEIIQEVSIMLQQAHAQSTDLTEEECAKYVFYVREVRLRKIGKIEVKSAEKAVTHGKKENAKKEKKDKKEKKEKQ